MWDIPLFDLNYDHHEERAVLEVLRSGWLTAGPKTRLFEERFADYLGGGEAVAVSSCTAALHLSLLACGIREGDEVIISGLSFVASLNVVAAVGAVPIPADSKSLVDWNVSAEEIEAKITSRTKAIIVVHFAGYPCDMDEIGQIARDHDLVLIEDVAHAVGADYQGRKCGTLGDLACFSFFSNKNLSTGEGGMVVAGRPELSERLKLLRSHGMTSMTIDRHNRKAVSYDVVMPGLNYRIDEIRATLGIEQLKKLDWSNRQRRQRVAMYHSLLGGQRGVVIPWDEPLEQRTSSYHIFTVLLPESADRKGVMEALKDKGIQTSIHYPAYRSFSCYRDILRQELPVAEEIARRVLTLPLYPSMPEESVEAVSRALIEELDKC